MNFLSLSFFKKLLGLSSIIEQIDEIVNTILLQIKQGNMQSIFIFETRCKLPKNIPAIMRNTLLL